MPSLAVACEAMRKACEDWSLGYDQDERYDIFDGGETDCSALVIWALRQGGFDTGDASYTGNMSDELCARGWKRVTPDLDDARPGDVPLNDERHTCLVIGGSGRTALVGQASGDERGRARGGQAGDQTGYETNIKQIYEYPNYGWDCFLRYVGGDAGEPADDKLDVDGHIGRITLTKWQKDMGTEPDGEISGQAAELADAYPRLECVTYERYGSELMVKVQEMLGIHPATGVIGHGTICYLQGHLVMLGYKRCLKGKVGVLDEPTAMDLQDSINDGKWKR